MNYVDKYTDIYDELGFFVLNRVVVVEREVYCIYISFWIHKYKNLW